MVNPSSTWGNFKDAILKKFGENEEPNERTPSEWLDLGQQPQLSKPPYIGTAVFTDIPKIKSGNEKVPLPISPSDQQLVTRGLPLASKFDPKESFPISCTTQFLCFKFWDPGGYIFLLCIFSP